MGYSKKNRKMTTIKVFKKVLNLINDCSQISVETLVYRNKLYSIKYDGYIYKFETSIREDIRTAHLQIFLENGVLIDEVEVYFDDKFEITAELENKYNELFDKKIQDWKQYKSIFDRKIKLKNLNG